MEENQKRQNLDAPSESQMNRTNNLRDAEEDTIRERSKSGGNRIQSDASGKAYYQTPDEYERDKNSNSKLSDTEIGGE